MERKRAYAQYLTLLLCGEMYAAGILNVKEIIAYGQLTEIPMIPAFIRGVINLRGSVVPVIDLAARFGGHQTEKLAPYLHRHHRTGHRRRASR